MATILVIDDDLTTGEILCGALRGNSHNVMLARSDAAAVVAHRDSIDFAIIALERHNVEAIELLTRIRSVNPALALVVVSGTMHANRSSCGATPAGTATVDLTGLVRLVSNLAVGAALPCAVAPSCAAHAAGRWAKAVTPLICSPIDPKTLSLWARHIGVSAGAIRNWCQTARLGTKRSLNFARMLRIVVHNRLGARPEDLLDIVDGRTLKRFLRLGANTSPPCSLPMTVEQFLERQQWITDRVALNELRRTLRHELRAANDSVNRPMRYSR